MGAASHLVAAWGMAMICGAIDLGGTKIEARLFGAGMTGADISRVATPTESYGHFMQALCGQIDWLCATAGAPDLAIGLSLAGVIDPATGRAFAANIPITGQDVAADLRARYGRCMPILNDCMAFVYSEAHGGAGAGCPVVIGLIMGTGVGAGIAINGAFPPRHNGAAIEIGHVGMPARALAEYDLPIWPCGCGKSGCIERYVSGTGLAALSAHRLGEHLSNEDLVARAAAGHGAAESVMEEWAALCAETILTLQLVADPHCVVLGGGLSKIPGVAARIAGALERRRLGPLRPPMLRIAQFGDSSGARGAALFARNARAAKENR